MNIYECLGNDPASRASLWSLGEALACTNAVLLIGEFETPGDPQGTGWAVWITTREQRRFRHLKRGTEYLEQGRGPLQSSSPVGQDEMLVSYRSMDGSLFFRPAREFDDGRFVEVDRAPTGP